MSRNKRDQELKEELEGHIRMAAQDRMDRGETPADAEANAKRELGNSGLVAEVTRETWGWAGIYRFIHDVRYGARVLRRNPVFAFVAILTLALGIGATTAIFSVVYGVLLRPLPYDKPQQIVSLSTVGPKGNRLSFSDANFSDVRAQTRSFQALSEYHFGVDAVSGGSEPKRVPVAYVSHDFFTVFAVNPVIGRLFVHEEEIPNGPSAAIVSYSFWKEYFGGRSDLPSLKLVIANHSVPVVGVLPAGFQFPGYTRLWLSSDTSTKPTSRTAGGWRVVGRIRDGLTLQQASAELGGVAQRIYRQFPQDNYMADAVATPLREALTDKARPALLILLEISGLLLLVACANVMNLLLAQATARESELAVRSALGASRGRLVRQFLAESLLLCLAGGLAGIAIAYAGVRLLLSLAPQNLPRLEDVGVNFPVLLFALVVSLALAAALGIFTALRAGSGDVQAMITQGSTRLSGAHKNRRTGQAIMAAQVAVTLVLLVGAGLLGRSFLRVLSVDPGFRTEKVVTLDLAFSGENANGARVALIRQILDRLHAIPGVVEAGATSDLPLGTGGYSDGTFALVNPRQLSPHMLRLINRGPGDPNRELSKDDYKALDDFFTPLFADKAHSGQANYVVASPGYFRALDIPLKRGRFFTETDTADATPVAIISEALARQTWPDRDPLGQTVEYGNMDGDLRLLTVVGVVGDIRGTSLEQPPTPIIYVNCLQRPQKTGELSLVIRTAGDANSTLSAARRVIREVDPSVPVKTNTFTRVFSASLATRRFNLLLVGAFAGTALLLAIAGIYGVLAYSVARRTRELGVRIALGASSSNVLGLVLRQAVITAAAGVIVGGVAACALTRFMRSIVFGVSTSDPLTYGAVAALLLLVALLAAYIPARRATRIDPMIALRAE
jgi:ABC-type antimicrobial peptide transport system permease subunit